MTTCSPQLSARILDFSLHCKTQTLYLQARTPDGKIYEFAVDLTPLFTGCDGQSLLIDTRFDNPTVYTNGDDQEVLRFDVINVATGDILSTQEVILPATGLPIGGTTGQKLVKVSGTDYDVEWVDDTGGGVTDHGLLTGLADDDHPQYHNDTRGDLRYAPIVHTHLEADVTDLDRVRWMGIWLSQAYVKNDMVKDGDWTAIANKATTDRPAPQPDGPPENSMVGVFTQSSDISIIKMVHEYTIAQDGFVESLAINPAFWDFNVVTKITTVNIGSGETTIYLNPLMVAGEWNILRRTSIPMAIGTVFRVEFEYYNTTPASDIRGDWTAKVGVGAPLVGEINIDNVTVPTSLVYSNTDSDAVDRTVELQGVAVNSILLITESGDINRFLHVKVTAIDISQPTYTTYTVSLIDVGNNIRNNKAVASVIDVPISQPSEYNVSTNYYLGDPIDFATITSELYYDGVLQPNGDDAYGINIGFQKADVSPDWDLVAYSSGQGVGGGGGGGAELFTDLLDTPADYIGQAGNKAVVRGDELGIEFVADAGGALSLEPYVESIDLNEMFTDDTETFNIVGGNFDSATTVELLGNTTPNIDSLVIHDDHNLTIVVSSTSTVGVATLLIKNGTSPGFGAIVGFNVRVAIAEFIYTAETTSPTESITLPLTNFTAPVYNFNVDWGDGSGDVITAYNQAEAIHSYATPGVHTIRIWGACPYIRFYSISTTERNKVRTVENLGATGWTSFDSSFRDLNNLTSFMAGDCDTSNVTTLQSMFYDCGLMTACDVSGMDTSSVTIMDRTFMYCRDLISLDVANWDCAQVTTMFYFCIGNNDLQTVVLPVSPVNLNLTTMVQAFQANFVLTSITGWSTFDTGAVTTMNHMFDQCALLEGNQLIGLNTAGATLMRNFLSATGANIGVGLPVLNTSGVTDASFFLTGSDITDVRVLENWNFDSATNVSSFFSSITSLNKCDASGFSFPTAVTVTSLFAGNKSSEIVFGILPAATTMTSMFSNCVNMTTVTFPVVAVNNVLIGSWSSIFNNCNSLVLINNLENFDTHGVTSFQAAFQTCTSLKVFDLSRINTESATILRDMFKNCSSLNNFTIGASALTVVNNLESMFEGCTSLPSIDFSNIDLSLVTTMSEMFYLCSSLASATFENSLTSVLNTCYRMFSGCTLIPDTDLNLDTSNVTIMDSMFQNVDGLPSVTNLVGGLDFTSAVDIDGMFGNCDGFTNFVWPAGKSMPALNSATSIFALLKAVTFDISEFDFSNVDRVDSMFNGNNTTTTITLPASNTALNLTNLQNFFLGCSVLVTINNLSTFDTAQVANFRAMFSGCLALGNVDIGVMITASATTMNSMFYNCNAMTDFPSVGIDTSNVADMSSTFRWCHGVLTTGFMNNFDFGNVTTMSSMFYDCNGVTHLDFSNADFTSLTTITNIAFSCGALTTVDFTGIISVDALTNMQGAFHTTPLLTSCNIDEFTIGNVNNYVQMFSGCPWSDADYDAMLLSYSAQVPVSNEPFVCSNKYTQAAARLILTGTYSWTITDDGPV